MPDTSLRLLTLLKLVPRRPPGMTCRTLQDQLRDRDFDVSLRTIQRDLEKLSGPFTLISDEGHPARWSWLPGSPDQTLPGHDPFSAMTWRLVEDHLQPLLPRTLRQEIEPQFQAARQFLEQSGSQRLNRWQERVRMLPRSMPLKPPEVEPGIMDAVYGALLDACQLEVSYHSRNASEARKLTINPLGLVVRDSIYYVLATVEPYTDVIQMVLHRMTRAQKTDIPALEPQEFNLHRYIEQGGFEYALGSPIRLVARFEEGAGHHLLESPLSDDQIATELDSGRMEIRATVRESAQLHWWLQGFGNRVEIIGPKALRQRIGDEIQALAQRYKD
jgi:predicted DNA-binding transcriptional regulator YafY